MGGFNPFAKRVPADTVDALVEEALEDAPSTVLQKLIADPPRVSALQFIMGVTFGDKVARLPAAPYSERTSKRAKRRARGRAKGRR